MGDKSFGRAVTVFAIRENVVFRRASQPKTLWDARGWINPEAVATAVVVFPKELFSMAQYPVSECPVNRELSGLTKSVTRQCTDRAHG
jgi:hypothetical protein